MNIVDLIAGQLSGDVLGKLGGLIGADESQTRSASTAAVPALLQIFGKMASTKSGADKLAGAMGGLDLSTLGNLAGMLGGGQAQSFGNQGGSLLGTLLGSPAAVSALTGLLGTFLKMNPNIVKSLLGYLAPVVLGMVAKQFTGRPDGAGVQRLFSEQASNISRAVPQGLSLSNVLSALDTGSVRPSEPSRGHDNHGRDSHGRGGHEPAPSGMPGWLLPLLLLGALGAGLYWWQGQQEKKKRADVLVEERVDRVGDTVVDRTAVIEREGKKLEGVVLEEVFKLPEGLGEASDVVKGLAGMFGDMTRTFEGITDEASARAALPEFEKFGPRLSGLEKETAELPEQSRSLVADFVAKGISVLAPMIDTAMKIPGVKALLGPVVGPLVETMSKLAK
jgi:hypothetical protein